MPLAESFSGIRGIYNKEFNEDVARKYAYCFYKYLKKINNEEPFIVLGIDPRPSSLKIKNAILEIFTNVVDIGIVPTPITQFSVRHFKAHGAIMITASHNEPNFNGIKLMSETGALLRPSEINKIISNYHEIKYVSEMKFYENQIFDDSKENYIYIHEIQFRHQEALHNYQKYLKNFITSKEVSLLRKLSPKILLDPNGGSGILAEKILKKFGVKTKTINKIHGKFKRVIEPSKSSLKYLKPLIKKNKAIFGAGFDCDADRVEIILEDGTLINGNYILAMAIDETLSQKAFPGKSTVVASDATSTLVRKIAENYKASLQECESGEINVLDKMLEYDSVIGGEGSCSGVILLPNRCRDGIVTLILILKMMANRAMSLEKIIKSYPKFYSERVKLKFNPKKHDKIKLALKNHYLKKKCKVQQTGDITGGLKIWLDENNFIWFRASKTEPGNFRIISDSDSLKNSKKILKSAVKVFNRLK